MAHDTVVLKLMTCLYELKRTFKDESYTPLVNIFSRHKLAREYGKFLIEFGVIIRVSGGKRGPSSYIWNKNTEVTTELAELLSKTYASHRRKELEVRLSDTPRVSNEERLIRIEAMLKKILSKLSNN